MKQSSENDTSKRRVATTMSATDVTKRSWIDLSSTEVFKRGTKEKSRRKSKISMTRQNSQNSSFGQWHGLVKVVSDETSSDESSFNNSGLGDSLSLPSDGSSLKSCTVEGMSFAMGSKRGSSYVNFDAVPRTPHQEEKSRWSRESRGSLKIQNNSFLKKKKLPLLHPPPIQRITEPLPHGTSFVSNISSTINFCEASFKDAKVQETEHEKIEDINQSDLCAMRKPFIPNDSDSEVSRSPSECQIQANHQSQAAIASPFSLNIKSQENESETVLVCANHNEQKIYSQSSATVVDTGQSDIDPIQVMRSITEPILRLSITLNSDQLNEIDESINNDKLLLPCLEASEYYDVTSESEDKHPPSVQVKNFTPYGTVNVDPPSFNCIKALDEANTSTTACSATTISEKSHNSSSETLSMTPKSECQEEPNFYVINPVFLPQAISSNCCEHTPAPKAPDTMNRLDNIEQLVLQTIHSSETYDPLEPNLDHEMHFATVDYNEPKTIASETQGVEFDSTDQQIIKVTGEIGKMLTSAESLVSTTQEGPIVTENDFQKNDSLLSFEGISSNAAIDPASPLIEIPSPSNNEFFVKEPVEQAFCLMPSINQKQTAFASIATVVVQPEPAPYWRIDTGSHPRLASGDFSEPTSFRANIPHGKGHSNRITPITRKVSATLNKHTAIPTDKYLPKSLVTFAPSISSNKSRFRVIQCKNLNSGLSFLSSSKNTKPHNLNETVRGTSRTTSQGDLSSITVSNVRDSSAGCIVRVYD